MRSHTLSTSGSSQRSYESLLPDDSEQRSTDSPLATPTYLQLSKTSHNPCANLRKLSKTKKIVTISTPGLNATPLPLVTDGRRGVQERRSAA